MEPYQLVARNTSTDSANKIHDDTVARQYGFSGGLVPGVVVHAYMTHPPAAAWGLDWVARGGIHSRFAKPVYDGDTVVVEPAGMSLEIRGAATATIRSPSSPELPDLTGWPHRPLPASADRPDAEVVVTHPPFGALDVHFHAELAGVYLDAIGEALPLYRDEGIAHPGWLIAQANYVLAANVVLGPWIHVESDVQHFSLVRDGELISTRAIVTDAFERKGHQFVELDVLIVAGDERPVLRARHVAIWRPRRLLEPAGT